MDIWAFVLKITRLDISSSASTLNESPKVGPNGRGGHEQAVSTADRTRNVQDLPTSKLSNNKYSEVYRMEEYPDEAETQD